MASTGTNALRTDFGEPSVRPAMKGFSKLTKLNEGDSFNK
jgi:hypothetical protein